MPEKKAVKNTNRGKPLNGKELSLIIALYTADLQSSGIISRVRNDYKTIAQSRKGIRKDISRPTLVKIIKEYDLEEMRLRNIHNIKSQYQDEGAELLKDKVKLTEKMLGVVVTRLLGDPDSNDPGVTPTFSDFDRLVRLGSFVVGDPDSCTAVVPGGGYGLAQIEDLGNLDETDLDREIAACDQALQAVSAAAENRA